MKQPYETDTHKNPLETAHCMRIKKMIHNHRIIETQRKKSTDY